MSNKGDQTREYICQEALQLFAERGFKEVTMKDICDRTGLSRGGLYRHYESTTQIFNQIIEQMSVKQDDEVAAQIADQVSAVSILTDILDRYRQEMLDHNHSLSIAFCEFFSDHPDHPFLYEQYTKSRATWEALIRYGMNSGEFNPVDPAAVYDLLVFAYQGVRMYSKMMPVEPETPDHIVTLIHQILTSK